MKFKNCFIILIFLIVLLCGLSTINAVSDEVMDEVVSEMDSPDDSISISNDESETSADEEDAALNAEENDSEVYQNTDDSREVLNKQANSSGDDILNAGNASSKSDLKIVNYTNFVKKGSKYYFYLTDQKGNAIANKKLTINYNGNKYEKTTDANGRAGIKVKLKSSSASMTVSYKGDSKYNALSKTLKFYIDQSLSISIGNTKLLTNGYLRVYLRGPQSSISNKNVKIYVGKKEFSRTTGAEGFVVVKPEVSANTYDVVVKYGNYVVSKRIKCVEGNVVSPLKGSIPLVNGVPDIDVMPAKYVMADGKGTYTVLKSQYQTVIKRDSQCLFLYGKMSKYTFFKTKDAPKTCHIIKREKWNVIEQKLNKKLVKKNRYSYWPSSITVSLKGKSLTYSEVRDVQNTGYTCGPTSASMCSMALRKYYSEKYFQIEGHANGGINIPDLKRVIDNNGFKSSYYYDVDTGVKQLSKGGVALIAFLPNHYVSILDVSPDGKKILVSNSYGAYDVGGDSRIPTGWVSVSYFKSKFAGVGLVVKLNYNLGAGKKAKLNNFYTSMGANWIRQNVNERIPNT